jgi:RHS repeat-associated protein
MQTTYRFLTIVSLAVIFSISALGQMQRPYDGFTPSGLQPGVVPASVPIDDFVQVNLATGALTFRLPLLTIGGRGKAGYTIYATIDNRFTIDHETYIINCAPDCIFGDRYFVRQNQAWANRVPGLSPGFLVARHAGRDISPNCPGAPSLYEQMLTRLTFVSNDGTEHEFVDTRYFGQIKETAGDCLVGHNRGTVWVTRDGTSATFISDNPISDRVSYSMSYPSGTLKWKDGTTYKISNGWVQEILDVNGNKVSIQYSGDAVTQITDSMGRVITTAGSSIIYKGFGGATRAISFNSADPGLRPDYSAYHTHGSAFPGIPDLQGPGTEVFRSGPTRITLPNGQFYRFYYNPYGELARIDLPTGGKIEFDYDGGYATGAGGLISAGSGIFRVVKERRVYGSAGDTIPAERMLFNRDSGAAPMVVDRVDPTSPAIILARTKHYFYGDPHNDIGSSADPITYSAWNDNLEYKTEYFAAGGATVLLTVDRVFNLRTTINGTNFDPRLTSETLTLNDSNLISRRTFAYDSYNNEVEVGEYGFGVGAPGSLLRRTQTVYLTNNPYQGNFDYAAEVNVHIRNLPIQQTVYDASGNPSSQTDYIYDDYGAFSLVECPGIVQHHGGFHTGYGIRGNLTGVIYHNPDGSPAEVRLSNQFDIAGNVVKVVNGRGFPTDFYFNDCFGSPGNDARSNAGAPELAGGFSYAFPTKVINALDHTTYAQYDYYIGKVVTEEDANGIVSSVAYNDALDRPTQNIQARYKVGVGIPAERRQTTFAYDNANRVITTTSDLGAFNDNILTTKAYYDGLGRTRRSAAREGATWTITDTRFGALGRVSQVSNPYRAADPDSASPPSGPFAEWTTTDYDALGRVIRLTTPDGAHSDTVYMGNQVTVIDQAGKKRRSETDALGRLIRVTEAPGELNYETYYSYDALGNLRQVTQGAQSRSFDYDSLSRLISATNPENGTMRYAYDANGNLTEKRDDRGVKTEMTYDKLNRVRSKVYTGLTSEGTAVASLTPQVNYFYDVYTGMPSGAPTFPGTPSKGKLVGVTYGTGSEGTYYKYDAAGRVVTNHQRQGTSNYVTTYVYNLAGSVTREDRGNPARRRNWMYYDEAGRLMSMQSGIFNANGFEPHDLVLDINYTPFGALQSETYGNGLIHSMAYNERHQPTEIRLGRSDNLESVFRIGYIHGTANNVNGQDPEITLAHNNGNVGRIKYFISGALQYSQTFQYDALNRLSYAVEHNSGVYNDAARAWYQTFAYDPYGNRGVDVENTSDNVDGGNGALKLADFSGANNRITRPGHFYDASGNLTVEPGRSCVYDAENRIVSAVVGGGATIQFFYDGNSRRVKKIVGGVATRFEYGAGGELITERNDSNSAVIKDYFYRSGELLGTTKAGTSGEYQFATADQLGSPRAWTDDSGALITGGRHDYLPFGEELFAGYGMRTTDQGYAANTQQDGQRKQFGSKERDGEIGLDFFISRYFSPTQGRYVSPDYFSGNPATLMNSFDRSSALPYAVLPNPQTLNLYSYVENNPLSLIDPDGHVGKREKLGRYTVRVDRSNPNDAPNIHVFDGKKELGKVKLLEEGPQFTGDLDSPKYAGLRRQLLEFAESKGIRPRTPNFGGGAAARGGRAGGTSNVFIALTVIQLGLDVAHAELDKRQYGFHVDLFGRIVIDDLNKAVNYLPRGTTIDVTIDGIRYHFVKLDKVFITTNPNCEYCTLEQDGNGNFRLNGRRTCCD